MCFLVFAIGTFLPTVWILCIIKVWYETDSAVGCFCDHYCSSWAGPGLGPGSGDCDQCPPVWAVRCQPRSPELSPAIVMFCETGDCSTVQCSQKYNLNSFHRICNIHTISKVIIITIKYCISFKRPIEAWPWKSL